MWMRLTNGHISLHSSEAGSPCDKFALHLLRFSESPFSFCSFFLVSLREAICNFFFNVQADIKMLCMIFKSTWRKNNDLVPQESSSYNKTKKKKASKQASAHTTPILKRFQWWLKLIRMLFYVVSFRKTDFCKWNFFKFKMNFVIVVKFFW